MDYKQILQIYLELLFYGVFGLSTLFLFVAYVASYKWPKLFIQVLVCFGVASIPFSLGALSRYFYEQFLFKGVPGTYQNPQFIALTIYFAVNGTLALHFWAKRVREVRLAKAQETHGLPTKQDAA